MRPKRIRLEEKQKKITFFIPPNNNEPSNEGKTDEVDMVDVDEPSETEAEELSLISLVTQKTDKVKILKPLLKTAKS